MSLDDSRGAADARAAAAQPPDATAPADRPAGRGADRRVEPYIGPADAFADPRDGPGYRRIESDAQRGPMGHERLDPNAIAQRGLQDCWVLAPLGAVAERQPDALRRRIAPAGDDAAKVRLGEGDGTPVVVERAYPVGRRAVDGRAVTLHAEPISGDWPAAFEKAIAATHRDGYQRLNRGGSLQDVKTTLEQLNGTPAELVDVRAKTADGDAQLLDALRERPAVVAVGTAREGERARIVDDRRLVDEHAYWVGDVTADGRVVLRNPWGTRHPDPITLDDLRTVAADGTIVVGGATR